jgi:hypothetical protein
MDGTLYSNKTTARLAAALFFLVCFPLAMWDQSYVPKLIFVAQDPAATATNLLANEFIFRTSIATHLTGFLAFVTMVMLFARVFRPVNKTLSQLMVISILAAVPVVFVLELFNFSALMILKSEPRPAFDLVQQQETAYLLIRIFRYGAGPGMGKFFLGLMFIPFGLLALRSGITPRFIGILILIGGVGYLADCCISILLQRTDYLLIRTYLMSTTLAYIFALLWFLIKGVAEKSEIRKN